MINNSILLQETLTAFAWLTQVGYDIKQSESSILFQKVTEEDSFSLGFSWAEYDYILINGIVAYKGFSSIEGIVEKVISRQFYHTIKIIYNNDQLNSLETVVDPKFNQNGLLIKSQRDVLIFSDLIKSFFYNEVQRFYRKYQTISNVFSEIEATPNGSPVKFIVNEGNASLIRILIIKYLVDPVIGETFFYKVIEDLMPLQSQKPFKALLENIQLTYSILTKE